MRTLKKWYYKLRINYHIGQAIAPTVADKHSKKYWHYLNKLSELDR